MSIIKVKASTFRHASLAAGVGGLAGAGLLLYRERIIEGFVLAFFALSAIAVAESETDFTAELNARSFAEMLTKRSNISVLGKLCDIASYFCLAGAAISWIALR